jgi:ADP-ribosylglycohydrolase
MSDDLPDFAKKSKFAVVAALPVPYHKRNEQGVSFMLGAICGDVIGRPFEFKGFVLTKDFDLFSDRSQFSDDTVMTAAAADAILNGRSFEECYVEYGRRHIEGGFGGMFKKWLLDDNRVQGQSWGNGSAMRVSAVAWLAGSLDEVIALAEKSALPSHASEEGIKGAVAAAAAVKLAIDGVDFPDIRKRIVSLVGYNLDRSVDQIRENYPRFAVSCQDSVPEAITCALEATSFEDAVRNAVSLGNDSDTQAAIAGSIAEARFGVPQEIADRCVATLTPDLKAILDQFQAKVAGKKA